MARSACPACGKRTRVPIAYGLPGPGGELMYASAQGLLAIGGDVVNDSDPRWFCSSCGHAWGRLDDNLAKPHSAAIYRALRKARLTPPPCPKCGSSSVKSFTHVMLEANVPASYWLIDHPAPSLWHCQACGHEWATPPRPHP